MENTHLGIASVPYQNRGDLFTLEEALKVGTVFKELNKPFFAAPIVSDSSGGNIHSTLSSPKDEHSSLLTNIQQISFFLDDLTLYLDTHAKDQEALTLYKDFSQKRADMKKQFADQFYPLTRDCIAACTCEPDQDGFCWQAGPTPWEGECI